MTPGLLRLAQALARMVLGLGLAAGVLLAGTVSGSEYQPVARAVMGLGCLGIGYLLGQWAGPLGRWRPPVPLSAEPAALPREGIGRVWVRGFAAGFWMLAAVGAVTTALYDFLLQPAAAGPALLPFTLPLLLLFGGVLVFAVPLATARGAVGAGEGLPRWTLVGAMGAAWAGGLAAFTAAIVLVSSLGGWQTGAAGGAASLLMLASVLVAAVGTPVLARGRWPAHWSFVWSLLAALLTLGAAGLLGDFLSGWLDPLGSTGLWLWLLSGCVLWGGPAGAVLVIAVARRQAAVTHAGSRAHRVGPVALAAGAVGLFCLGLLPLGAWVLLMIAPGPLAPTTPAAPSVSSLPMATQPGTLSIPGPALAVPAAGAVLPGAARAAGISPAASGSVWRFSWRPSPGSSPADLYEFTLWPPGSAMPALLTIVPGTQIGIAASPLLHSPPALRPPGGRVAMPPVPPWPPGPWTWRVRVVRPGQGAGQWSEARPFTPAWK